MLLAEGREETNWEKVQEAYNQVQRSIGHNNQLELYTDVECLLPDDIELEYQEMEMSIQEYVGSATERSHKDAVKGSSKKCKQNDDPAQDIPSPPGVSTGFVSVADLLIKQNNKKQGKGARFDNKARFDDETNKVINVGLFGPRWATSMSAASSKPPKAKLPK